MPGRQTTVATEPSILKRGKSSGGNASKICFHSARVRSPSRYLERIRQRSGRESFMVLTLGMPVAQFNVAFRAVCSNSVRQRRRRSWAACGLPALAHTLVWRCARRAHIQPKLALFFRSPFHGHPNSTHGCMLPNCLRWQGDAKATFNSLNKKHFGICQSNPQPTAFSPQASLQ